MSSGVWCCSVLSSGVKCHSVLNIRVQCCVEVFRGVQWCSVVFSGVQCCSVVFMFNGISCVATAEAALKPQHGQLMKSSGGLQALV